MKKTRIIFPILIGATLLGVTVSTLPKEVKQNATVVEASYEGTVKEPISKTQYFIDELLTIAPKDIVYNARAYVCSDFYLIYPDKSQKSGQNFKLDQTGEYTIVYIAKDGDKVIEAREKIYALKKAYSTKKDASTSMFVDEIMCDQTPTAGIRNYLVEGDTWTYNQAIDISDASLEKPLIKYYTRQNSELAEHMSLDVLTTVVRITDFYDENNYIEIYNTYNETNPSTKRMQPYVLAGAYGQVMSGIDLTNRSSKTISYEGVTYYLHNNKSWGACLDTYPGKYGIDFGEGKREYDPDIANSDNLGFAIYYDYATKKIQVRHRLLHLVTDLDEPAIYSNNLFKGFTTGEVIISMRCESYKESLGFFEISEIYGKKGNDLNTEYAYDDKAPIILLENEANDFYIAKDEPFTLFNATATDPHIVGGVTTKVYYDYGTPNQRFVPITDNKFTPTSVGKYTIIYGARDSYGNETTKEVVCNAITAKNNHIVDINFAEISEGDAGSLVKFTAPELSGYNKGLFWKIYAFNQKNNDFVEIDNDKLELFLKFVGEYKIFLEYGDISCSRIKEFVLNSKPSNNAYLETTNFPKYFIKDAEYSLDKNRTVLCTSETPSYTESQVFVKYDDGEYEATPINPKDITISGSHNIQFKYVYNGNTIYETEKFDIVNVDFLGNYNFDKYFVGDFEKEINSDGVSFISSINGGDGSVEFINPLSFDLLRLEFLVDSKIGYKTIDFIMKDYYGIDNDFVISFFYSGNTLCFSYNGVKGEIGLIDKISFSYDSLNESLSVGNGVSLSIKNPFRHDKFYLTVKATNLTLGTSETSKRIFTATKINNQNLTVDATGGDFTQPQIAYTKLKGQRNINSSVYVKRTSCCDVLSPYLSKYHKVTAKYKANADVKDADAEFLVSTDGVTLNGAQENDRDYEILLSRHGVYVFTYSYQDQAGNRINVTEIVYVEDNEAPEITIDGGATNLTVDVVPVNKEMTVRNCHIKDESAFSISIYAISPLGKMYKLEKGKLTPDVVGDWHIVYYAIDANYNVGTASYIVRAK